VANHEQAYYPGLTLQEATVFSVNVPYAYLTDLIGPERVVAAASAAGLDTELAPVPSIVLGTQDVTVAEMAEGYATFANNGIHVEPVLVTRIEDASGTVIYEHIPTYRRVFSEETAAGVTAVLTEVVRRGTGQQAKIGRPIAGKTGTTENSTDAWFIGYTPEFVAAVWVGFPQGNIPMVAPQTEFTITGGTWPARIWSRLAIAALEGVAYSPPGSGTDFELVTVDIDTTTGFLAGPLCPRAHVATLQLRPGAVPSIVCPIHNPQGLAVLADGVVPDVTNRTVLEAVSLLEAGGYEITMAWVGESPDQTPGTIAFHDPAPGQALAAGEVVALRVWGPEPGTVIPDVVGRHRAEAIARLEGSGHMVDIVEMLDPTPDETTASRLVWGQFPGAGEPTTGRVTIWVQP
jgi:penicillin-binding protein 1A